jgi:hypothetical protein
MPSFLSKVFARSKKEEPAAGGSGSAASTPPGVRSSGVRRDSSPSLLDGKYEAVSASASPTAARFAQGAQEHLGAFGTRPHPRMPQLSLHLPERNGGRAELQDVFVEGTVGPSVLADEDIGARRLNPAQTLALVEACSKYINERGTSLAEALGCDR